MGSYPLIVKEDVKKKNIFKLFLDNLKDIVVGNLVFYIILVRYLEE